MKNLTITIQVKDDLDAYKVLNKINYTRKVIGAKYNNKTFAFDKNNLPQDFLRKKKGNWGK